MIRKILKTIIGFILLLNFSLLKAQESIVYRVSEIDSTLIKNANAVVRLENVSVQINSINSVTVTTKRAVTVLNKYGDKYADYYESYDPETKIKKAHAVVYDANGNQIKEYKKKDFHDRSATDGFSLIGDGRYIYFDYVPVSYPYTLVYESEVQSKNTAFLNRWFPVVGYHISVEKSMYKVVNPNNLEIRSLENKFDEFPIEYNKEGQQRSYVLSNLLALKKEMDSPPLNEIVPSAKITLNNFTLVNVKGSATDWEAFGKWQYENLILGRDILPEETINKISQLVASATSIKEKAKLIYEYVQNKTRYISVQLGIGGWMPMKASDVDRLGYGDCKALSNYTKALLSSQDIQSYFTIVYAKSRRDIDSDFASMQGNHAILNIPDNEGDIWLECTSQTLPFNFIGGFTDNRDVLVIKPEGGVIKRTKKYTAKENLLKTNALITLNTDKSMSANITRDTKGLQYDGNYLIQYQSLKDQKMNYKKHWDYINGLGVEEVNFKDDKEEVVFTEKLDVSCASYLKKFGNKFLFAPNIFNQEKKDFPKYKSRKRPLVIERGYLDTDEYVINLPEGYSVTDLPEDKFIENEFGKYTYQLAQISASQINFKRTMQIDDGVFPKEKYEEYRKFRESIKKADQTKIVLEQQ